MSEPSITNIYDNLPDNCRNPRTDKSAAPSEEKRATKVVQGRVKTRKNEMRKLTDIFITEDVSNVKQYILLDVLVPSIKDAIYKIITGALDMSLYGGRGGGGKRPTADRVSYTDYGRSSRRDDSRSRSSSETSSVTSYDDIILESRGEAEAVLSRMDELMEEYEIVRVADLYDLVGKTGSYTDYHYGWTNIRNAEVVRVRDGYKIKMPRAAAIRK